MDSVKSILIVGVGGQGTLLLSRLIGNVALNQGYDVKVSEVHGMSQRGGSVITYVRYGDKVFSPLIEDGEADYILAFEQLEAARFLPKLKKDGHLIVNTQRIDPMPVIAGNSQYPNDIIKKITEKGVNVIAIDAMEKALKAGSIKSVNIVLLGVFAKIVNLDKSIFEKAIKESTPDKFIDINLKAFELGYKEKIK